MDNTLRIRPFSTSTTTTATTTITSIRTSFYPPVYDRAQEKLIRHKLFLLSCEKLANLRQSNAGTVLRRNLAILGVTKKARSSDYYPVNECVNLLSSRETNTKTGPLFARRSSSISSSSTSRVTLATTTTQAVVGVPSSPVVSPPPNEDSYPTFMPIQKTSIHAPSSQMTKPEKTWSCCDEEVIEYSIKDVHRSNFNESDFEVSCENEIEEGTDALDVFFMDEDTSASMARKRKSNRWDSVAEKRYCDEEVISPKSVTAPIPIPRPVKQPDQVVLDTLVPMRGFFQFR